MSTPIKLGVALMVKNESRVIERCLKSILPIADHVIITDTGSTDDTIAKAGLFLQNHGIKYNIYTEPFVDFAHNRNRLLELYAISNDFDWVLMIDADDTLEYNENYDKNYFKSQLYSDYCDIKHVCGDSFSYHLPKLTKNGINVTYRGVTHEHLETRHYSGYINPYIWINQLNDGHRRTTGSKFTHDIELMENELHRPDVSLEQRTRYLFYLGETNRNIGDYNEALKCYSARSALGGWKEEVFYSYYQMGRIHEIIKSDELMITLNYHKAYETCPHRIESLVALYNYWKKLGYTYLPQLLLDKIANTPKPDSGLFIEEDKYDFKNIIL